MTPKKLGKVDKHKQELWKAPLPIFIETLYFKRFGRDRPEEVITIKQRATERAPKQAARRAAKAALREAAGARPPRRGGRSSEASIVPYPERTDWLSAVGQ
jgi:hypothetical protein